MYCFIGNSHLHQFNINGYRSQTGHQIDTIECTGASIKGLVNLNSKLQVVPMIKEYQSKNPSSTFIFFLGQVDLDFGYYFKCVKDGTKHDIHAYIDNLIGLYETFLSNDITNPFCVLGINPSVIRDIRHNFNVSFHCPNGKDGFYSEIGQGIQFEDVKYIYSDSLETRCAYTKMFNKALEEMCKRRNFKFIDISPVLFDGNVLKSKYVPVNEMDHHLKLTTDTDMIEFIFARLA